MTSRTIAAGILAVFVVGFACGWALNPVEDRTQSGRVPSTPAHENNATDEAHGNADTGAENERLKDWAMRLNEILSIGNQFKRARAIAAIADDLDLAQVRAALDELARSGGFRSDEEREEIAERLLARWGELDPHSALDRAMTFPMERRRTMRAVIQGWAGKDAEAAGEWVASFNSPLKETARRGLILGVADTDPKRAFALLEGLSQWSDRDLAEAVFSRWTENDPADAAAHAAQLPSGYFRDNAMSLILRQWADLDGESAVAWAESLQTDNPLISKRPRNTIPFSAGVLELAAKTWMEREPAAAMQWFDKISDEKKRNDLLGALISLTADEDPPRAAQLLIDLIPPGKLQDDALTDLTARWNNTDARGALAWAAQQTDAHVREIIIPGLALHLVLSQNLAPQDTQTALQLAQSLSDSARDKATRYVLGAWAANDPAAAAAWVAPYSNNPDYLRSVAFQWVRKDPDAASRWMDAIPASPAKDEVLSLATDQNFWIDPQVAARWIEGISDAQKREAAYKHLAGEWLKADVNAARDWIATTPLAQDVKDQLLKTDAR